MLKIRLARIGKKKQPIYRLIISENARDTYGKALEILGNYNPFTKVTEVKKDRILYWISKGAQVSPTAHNLLVSQNVLEGKKVRAYSPKKKEKTEEEKTAETKAAEGSAVAEETKAEAPVEESKEEKPTEVAAEEKKEEKAAE